MYIYIYIYIDELVAHNELYKIQNEDFSGFFLITNQNDVLFSIKEINRYDV